MSKTRIRRSLVGIVALFGLFIVNCSRADVFNFDNTVSLRDPPFVGRERIDIGDFGPASRYPSTIGIGPGLSNVTDVNVTIFELTHSFVRDIDILLVGPTGASVILMRGAGSAPVSFTNIIFDDEANQDLPDSGSIAAGRYRPTDYFPNALFFPPVPAGPYGTTLSVFDGQDPTGLWSLYVADSFPLDSGAIGDGWRLTLDASVDGPQLIPLPRSLSVFSLGVLLLGLLTEWKRRPARKRYKSYA